MPAPHDKVLPPERVSLPENDDELLAECDVETFRASGRGGQHVNTTESAVRLRHRPTGIVVTSQQERSQHRNKMIAVRNLRDKIERHNYRPPVRVPTRKRRAAKNRTLQEKAERSETKQLRRKPRIESDES